jgi:hypothetical protein
VTHDKGMAFVPKDKLKERLDDLLGGSLGLNVFPQKVAAVWRGTRPTISRGSSAVAGFRMAITYAALFIFLPWLGLVVLGQGVSPASQALLVLQAYGAFWSGWATATTRLTSASIERILYPEVVDLIPESAATSIELVLRRRFPRARILAVSWTVAAAGATLAGVLIYGDLKKFGPPHRFEVLWWSLGWAICFATATKVVITSSFYRLLPTELERHPSALLAIKPADSSLVRSITSIAGRMLLFWFGIALSIALAVPFALREGASGVQAIFASRSWKSFLESQPFTVDTNQNGFIVAFVLITTVFSIGGGITVFLRSEAAVRRWVRAASIKALRDLELKLDALRSRLETLNEDERKQMMDFITLHGSVTQHSSYRSLLVSTLSLLLPFIPLISLFRN